MTIASDEDANRNDVVTELIDIWIELKELKDGILTFLNEENDFIEMKSKSPLDEFNRQVQLTKEEWDELAKKKNCALPVHLANTMINYAKKCNLLEKLSSKWNTSERDIQKHIMPMAAYITEGFIDVLE